MYNFIYIGLCLNNLVLILNFWIILELFFY